MPKHKTNPSPHVVGAWAFGSRITKVEAEENMPAHMTNPLTNIGERERSEANHNPTDALTQTKLHVENNPVVSSLSLVGFISITHDITHDRYKNPKKKKRP